MRLSYHTLYEPGDERDGLWSREQLLEMNARFTERLEEAFRLGLESRASAASQVKLPASTGPRWATPLTREIQDNHNFLRVHSINQTVYTFEAKLFDAVAVFPEFPFIRSRIRGTEKYTVETAALFQKLPIKKLPHCLAKFPIFCGILAHRWPMMLPGLWPTATGLITDKQDRSPVVWRPIQNFMALTEKQVKEIYFATDTLKILAQRYPVGVGGIQSIKRGKSWKHVTKDLGPAHRNRRGPPRKVKIIKPRKNRRIGTPFPEGEKEGTDAA